jgi:hypothetical protein
VSQIQYPYPEVNIVDWMAGVEWERERILKWVEATTDWDDFGEFIVYKDDLLALIKGEK